MRFDGTPATDNTQDPRWVMQRIRECERWGFPHVLAVWKEQLVWLVMNDPAR